MLWLWISFICVVLVLIALDLFVFHRKDEVVTVRSALLWSVFWVSLALIFNVAVYFMYEAHWLGLGTHPSALHHHGIAGREAAVLFFTGYVVEQTLSMDNLFVIAIIFRYFAIPAIYQHRVLFWGIIGVLVLRGLMIAVGAALISRFDWLLYVFGGILLITAFKMLFGGGEPDPHNNFVVRIFRRFFPITHEIHGHRFAVHRHELRNDSELEEEAGGREPGQSAIQRPNVWVLTPLALALIVVETTDLVFAVDSIPAIFAITTDPFLVFTSNVFAVLGLRSLYFALAGVLDRFRYLKVSLAAILGLVGIKMLASHWLHDIPHMNFYMLAMVAALLLTGVVASLISPLKPIAEPEPALPLD